MVHAVGLSAVGDNVRVSSSRAVGTKGVPRAQREQLILDAATFEFGRFGYAGAALSAVAAQAGVSKPLVLSYFGSKDGLFSACVQRAGTNVIDHIEAVLATQQPPPQMADETLTAILRRLQRAPTIGMSSMTEPRPPEGRRTRRHNASAPPSPTRPRVEWRPLPTCPTSPMPTMCRC